MGFPRQRPTFIEGIPVKHRAHETAKGTRQKPLPSVGSSGPHRPRHYTKQLVENALRFGYVNGVKIGKR